MVAIEQQVQDANAFLDGNQNDPNSIRYTPDKFESMLGNVETAIANLGSFCFYLGDNNPYTASRLYLMQKSGSAFSLVEEKLFALRSSNISKPASPRKTSQSTHSKPSTAYGETVLPPILQSSKPATASLDVKPNSPIKEHSFARDLNSLASKPTTPFKNTSTKPGTPAAEQALSELVPNTLAIKQAQFAFKLKIAVDALIESTFISGHLPVLAPLPNTKAATLGYASAQINEYSNSTLNGITDRLDSLKASLAHVVSNLSAGHILCTFTEAVSQHESAARDLAKKYASERASIMVTKGQCDNQLKQRLGHPSNTAQLAALDTLAKTTIKAMLGNIETHLADSLSTHAQINQLLLTRAQATCQRIGTIAQIAHYQNIDMGSIDDIREFLAGLGATRGERVGEWMESEKRAEEQWLEKWNMQHDRIAHLY